MMIELERPADLFDVALVEHHDLVGHGHRFHLVVRDVDHRGLQFAVKAGQLSPHLYSQLGVEVGERLVEQKHLGLAHDGAADRHALTLAAGQRPRLALQQLGDLQDARRVLDAVADHRLLELRDAQSE